MKNKGMENFIIDFPVIDKRGFRVERCNRCHLPIVACICRFAPNIKTKANFWLIMYELEFLKPTNTGKLIAESIESTYSFKWKRNENPEDLVKLIDDQKYNTYLVFPDDVEDYKPRSKKYEEVEGKDPAFIILDGTWTQARKMFRKSKYLEKLPLLSLNTERESEYVLRSPSDKNHICTVEVAIELLKIVGDEQASKELNDYFKLFLKYYLAGRNNHLPLEDEI
ncbi:MAG: DTW domain-containing protein [Pedobacter sp.]|nr:MAG: DTW domain-containing protein [Pedobacter sp.]